MSNAGDNGTFGDSQGWLEPFRVFFDRSFVGAFETALTLADGDDGKAARICAHTFARAYSRWAFIGRIGDPEAFVHRQLKRSARRADETPPILEAGVGFKPWVYVSAIESGSTRKRAMRAVSGAGATAAFVLLAIPALTPAPKSDVVSIRSESVTPTSTTTTSPPTTVPFSLIPATSVDREDPGSDRNVEADAAEDSDRTGFTLDLSGLPTSPDQISRSANASIDDPSE